jgi:hypothetical protein
VTSREAGIVMTNTIEKQQKCPCPFAEIAVSQRYVTKKKNEAKGWERNKEEKK